MISSADLSRYFSTYEFPINLQHLDNKIIFITGGTGFFGIWLLSLFKYINEEFGVNVKISVLSRNPNIFLSRYNDFNNLDWLTWLIGDVRHHLDIDMDCDYVIHGATDTSIDSHRNYYNMFETIISGTKNILEVSLRNKARRILLISSGAAYGEQPFSMEKLTECTHIAPQTVDVRSVYGEAKRCMEMLGTMFSVQEDIHVNYARCFTFMGPGIPLNGQFAFGNFIRDALRGQYIHLNTSGNAIRSYLHGADLAVWLLTILLKGEKNEIYNVGSSNEISIRQLAEMVKVSVAPEKGIKSLVRSDTSPTRFNRYVPCTKKIQNLGCIQHFSIIDGIKHTYNFAKGGPRV